MRAREARRGLFALARRVRWLRQLFGMKSAPQAAFAIRAVAVTSIAKANHRSTKMSKGLDKKKEDKKKPAKTLKEKRADKAAKKTGK